MSQAGITMQRHTTLTQRLPVEHASKDGWVLEACYKIKRATNVYAGPHWECRPNFGVFDMLMNVTMREKGTKMVLISHRQQENQNYHNAKCSWQWTYTAAILHRETMPKEKLLMCLVFWCQEKASWPVISWLTESRMSGTEDQVPFSASALV